jgi:hypothetical protein
MNGKKCAPPIAAAQRPRESARSSMARSPGLVAMAILALQLAGQHVDAQCLTRVDDCWQLPSEQCAVSFDYTGGYRRCVEADGEPCDGSGTTESCPSFDPCGEDLPADCGAAGDGSSNPPASSGGSGGDDDDDDDDDDDPPAGDGGSSPVYPEVLCDPTAPGQGSCTEFDTDGDGVKEVFPAWIAEPLTVTVPSGADRGDAMQVTLGDGQEISIKIPDVDLGSGAFEFPLLTRDCLVFCESDSMQSECCASFFGESYIVGGGEADPWGRWSGSLGHGRIYSTMRPLPEIQSVAGSTTASCVGNTCNRAWFWAGLFEPPTPGTATTYTLTFRKGEVIDSWYGGYNSKLYSVQLAFVPVPDGGALEDSYAHLATKFGGDSRQRSTNDCRLDEYPVADCGASAGYIPGAMRPIRVPHALMLVISGQRTIGIRTNRNRARRGIFRMMASAMLRPGCAGARQIAQTATG